MGPCGIGQGNKHVLPKSTLSRPFEIQMGSWMGWRVQIAPFYCANCGKPCGHCPVDNQTFIFYLCSKCFEVYGNIPGTYSIPDEEWCKAVEQEMISKFGRALTEEELFALDQQGQLGSALEKLAKESPFPVPSNLQ